MKSKLLFTLTLLLFFIPAGVFAAEFRALVGIPGIENIAADGGLNQYINALYRLSISIAALLAVIKIVIAGAKYMLTDIVPAKEEAKKDIQGALIGLLIVIGAIIILNTINTDLANVNFNLEGVELDDAPVLTGNDQRDAACVGGCTYLNCTQNAQTLQNLSQLPAGSSCRQMCNAVNGFYYQTENAERECAVNAASYQNPGSNVVSIPCTDVRNDPTYINGIDYSCTAARAECASRGGTLLPNNFNNLPALSCSIPRNSNSSSTPGFTIEMYTCPSAGNITCAPERGACTRRGGTHEDTTTGIVCTIPVASNNPGTTASGSVPVAPSENTTALEAAREQLCEEGYDCEVTECEAWTNFGCTSWCQTESGFTGDYDSASGMCYANTRDSAEVIAAEAAAAAEASRQQEAVCRATTGRIWVNGACQDEFTPPISP